MPRLKALGIAFIWNMKKSGTFGFITHTWFLQCVTKERAKGGRAGFHTWIQGGMEAKLCQHHAHPSTAGMRMKLTVGRLLKMSLWC